MYYNRIVIDIQKACISGEDVCVKIDEAQKKLAIELDRRKVYNEPCDEINSLYEDVMWLKCEVLPERP